MTLARTPSPPLLPSAPLSPVTGVVADDPEARAVAADLEGAGVNGENVRFSSPPATGTETPYEPAAMLGPSPGAKRREHHEVMPLGSMCELVVVGRPVGAQIGGRGSATAAMTYASVLSTITATQSQRDGNWADSAVTTSRTTCALSQAARLVRRNPTAPGAPRPPGRGS